ncbi:universal stress protein [Sedimentitalea todarodis]|uniref:Universal stress protein n=1 Tax=Sedimentitalea todarodis TaxID=1631240 RepID=A0ABU3VFS1_9RHOB|nr:universal stress protein [Sedimentitalea todarodis]MDU9004840.1 universal stress protein [Sedimentitalea todarodis]
MTAKLVVGLDGHSSGERALDYAQKLAGQIGACELLVVYIIEWSPYAFQTPEENEQRHKRREKEIASANERIIAPAVERLTKDGLSVRGIVRHGNVADALNEVALKENAEQIIVARASERSLSQRIFGSSTANLVMEASVPVTVVG